MFLLIFRYVFGGAVETGPVPYVAFLVPGYVVTSVLFTGSNVSSGVAEDLEQGFTDRCARCRCPRAALMAGRVVAETGLLALGLAVTTAIGFVVGFRPEGSAVEALLAFGLCIVFGFALMWMFVLIGLVAGNAQAAQGMSLLVFPLSSCPAPSCRSTRCPAGCSPSPSTSPITVVTNAVRSLALGDPALAGLGGSTTHWVVLSLAWSVAIVALFAPLAVLRYRRS